MSSLTLKDVRLLSGGYEITSDHNSLSMQLTQDAVEATVFGNDSRVFRPGLKMVDYTLNGFFDSDGSSAINDIQAAQRGTAQVMTVVAPVGAVGAASHSFSRVESSLSPFGGTVGDMSAFTASGQGKGDVFRGQVFEAGTTARSSSSSSSAVQLTGVSAGEKGFAALHVIATTGSPTLDVVIESDATNAFSGSESTYLTFTQATAIGAQFISDDTAESDTYWRADWTFGGTGSITFLVTFGIA